MPIFGQVWLWSLLAFLFGALLCWLLLVLPVRRRIGALESRLASVRADATRDATEQRSRPADRPPSSARGMVPGFDDTGNQDEIRSEMLTRAYALPGVQDIPSTPYEPPAGDEAAERGALSLSSHGGVAEHVREPATPRSPDIRPLDPTQYIGAHSEPLVAPAEDGPTAGSSGRDWFDEEAAAGQRQQPAAAVVEPPPTPAALPTSPASHRLIDDEDVEERGTIFTQRTMPIPAEVIRQLDEAGSAEAGARPEDALVDDLEDEPAPVEQQPEVDVPVGTIADTPPRGVRVDQETMRIARPEPVEPPPTPAVTLDTILAGAAEPVRSEVDEPAPPEPEPEPVPLATRAKATNRHTIEPRVVHGSTVEPELTQALLPKRVPSKPQHRAPFGVQTVSPAEAHAAGGERIRSLFEPMVPAESEQEAVPPPPHRLHTNESRPSAPGPFGSGSAMPLPGGASPSPEFTIKASVTALRYCTPESPQFGRTVAEVWFRSAADAERVGFRPVGSA